MKNYGCNVPAILLVDSSGYDGGSQPADVLKAEVREMMDNQRKKRLMASQASAMILSAQKSDEIVAA